MPLHEPAPSLDSVKNAQVVHVAAPAPEYEPASHFEQPWEPVSLAKVPAAQVAHWVPAVVSLKVPLAQAVHALWPAAETLPAAQSVQLEAPALSAKLPAAQATQLVLPTAL